MASDIETGIAMVKESKSTSQDADTRSTDLAARIAAAVDLDWQQPPVVQQSLRAAGDGEYPFSVGVMWPTGAINDGAEHGDNGAEHGDTAHRDYARALEAAGIDYVLMADGWANTANGEQDAGLRAVLWAVPVILATQRLGVVTGARSNFMAPMHIARFGSHLDWLSQGRWGCCVVPGSGREAARLYGLDDELPLSEQYAKAAEVVAAVEAIWAGGEAGVDFDGHYVRVHGQSKRPFPTQSPRPPLFGAGSSGPAKTLAARSLDVWITADGGPDTLAAARQTLAEESERAGRPTPPRIHLQAALRPGGTDADDTAKRAHTLAQSGLIDGLLIDLPDRGPAGMAQVASLLTQLTELGVIEDQAVRTARW